MEDDALNEIIINSVRPLRPLWDKTAAFYKDNAHKKKLWIELANDLQITEDFLKTRWKSLRDRYFKEKKKFISKSGQAAYSQTIWAHMQSLSFLSDTVHQHHHQIETSMRSENMSSCSAEMSVSVTRENTDAEYTDNEILESPLMSPRSTEVGVIRDELSQNRPGSSNQLVSGSSMTFAGTSKRKHASNEPQSRRTPKSSRFETDPVERAILNFVEEKKQGASEAKAPEYTTEELFYLSIAREAQNFDLLPRMQMRQAVLNAFVEIFGQHKN